MIKISTDSFYPLQLPPATTTNATNDKTETTNESSDELLHGNALYDQTSRALDDMLNTIIGQDGSNEGLSAVFKHVEPWLTSVNEWERLRSIKTLSRCLKHFLEIIRTPKSEEVKAFNFGIY